MHDFEQDGYALAKITLDPAQCDYLSSALPSVVGAGRAGVRNLISHPTVAALLHHEGLGTSLWSFVERELVAVKATLFDKTQESNWRVQWHQDRSIAVRERREVAGYSSWSSKGGSIHVEPPANVLAQMVAIRIHLDASGAENGPLRVVPGSHQSGILSDRQLSEAVAGGPHVIVCVPRGGLLLMRPLLVHSSTTATAPAHRRVLHIEFAPQDIISPLYWDASVSLRRAA